MTMLHYAKCHYAECHILFIIMLSVIMLSVIMLSVFMLSVLAPYWYVGKDKNAGAKLCGRAPFLETKLPCPRALLPFSADS